jgi:hypothetical protein
LFFGGIEEEGKKSSQCHADFSSAYEVSGKSSLLKFI